MAIGLTSPATLTASRSTRTRPLPPSGTSSNPKRGCWNSARQFVEDEHVPEEQKLDLVERLSTAFHEYQHFQDLLCTVFGSVLVRQTVRLTARYGVLVDEVLASVGNGPLRVPFATGSASSPGQRPSVAGASQGDARAGAG